MKQRLIFLVGPTAAGKTAVSLSLAKAIGAEIVSCDSMQVYRGMDIISSKPSRADRAKIPHHLVDIVSPRVEFNAARYRLRCLKVIREIGARGKVPLFVGGTGLYVSVLVEGIFKTVKIKPGVRERLSAAAAKMGSAALHARLAKVDPAAAAKIHPNDARRVIRALEVFESTGTPISVLQAKRNGLWDKYDIHIFCLSPERTVLYRRINGRVEAMFRRGLVEEVKKLRRKGMAGTARFAIGIPEVEGYLDGRYGKEEAKALLQRNTRQYAKRQLTWFRKDKRIVWVKSAAQARRKILALCPRQPRRLTS